MDSTRQHNITNNSGTFKKFCSRNTIQTGTTSSSNMDALATRLCNSLKYYVVAHGNRVKYFEDLTCNDVIIDNVKHLMACYCHRFTQNKITKGWFKPSGWDQSDTDRLSFNTIIKHVEKLFAILQNCWPKYPNLQGSQ